MTFRNPIRVERNGMRLRLALLIASAWLVAATAFADDWPQWRGPNRDEKSMETRLNTNWATRQPKLLWTCKEVGSGYSGPAVVGDVLYSLGAADGKDIAFALDTNTGKRKWKQVLGPAFKHGTGDGSRSTPT